MSKNLFYYAIFICEIFLSVSLCDKKEEFYYRNFQDSNSNNSSNQNLTEVIYKKLTVLDYSEKMYKSINKLIQMQNGYLSWVGNQRSLFTWNPDKNYSFYNETNKTSGDDASKDIQEINFNDFKITSLNNLIQLKSGLLIAPADDASFRVIDPNSYKIIRIKTPSFTIDQIKSLVELSNNLLITSEIMNEKDGVRIFNITNDFDEIGIIPLKKQGKISVLLELNNKNLIVSAGDELQIFNPTNNFSSVQNLTLEKENILSLVELDNKNLIISDNGGNLISLNGTNNYGNKTILYRDVPLNYLTNLKDGLLIGLGCEKKNLLIFDYNKNFEIVQNFSLSNIYNDTLYHPDNCGSIAEMKNNLLAVSFDKFVILFKKNLIHDAKETNDFIIFMIILVFIFAIIISLGVFYFFRRKSKKDNQVILIYKNIEN